ncbi:putative ABC transport system permease protein [Ekhidna lutea]|uniref:Putative ABC transport system permease protein n=1 Tax=Ekhidna lutea TaxID=447679 RepID=A0A239H1H3_EKHLU|nr:ABC transporter permease [Ekhidna lutea]SNS74653.1 putative ABC transport system permease protein [Ekhidna lutea]
MNRIPKLGEKWLELILPERRKDLLIGDFEEYFEKTTQERGRRVAVLLFWYQVLLSSPSFVYHSLQYKWLLFRHSLILAFRNLHRHLGHSALNLLGLALGISCFVILMLYVQEEKSYDKWHEKANRIHRVLDIRKVNDVGEESTSAPTPLAEAMLLDYPDQIEEAVRLFNFQAPTLALAYHSDNGTLRQFNEPNIYFADDAFFRVFDFNLIEGNPELALNGPNKIILSQEMAEKYFRQADPIGKTLRFEGEHDLIVSGVFSKIPANTHFKFDFLISFSTLDNPQVMRNRLRKSWVWNPSWTYLLLDEDVKPEVLEAQFPDFVQKHFPESRKDRVKLFLQPLTDIHLYSNLDYEMGPNGNIIYVYIFTTVAFFILLISYINFMNLSTARASTRAKEIGVRKVLGGKKIQLIGQLLNESIIANFIAVLISIPMVYFLLELIQVLIGKELILNINSLPIQPWETIAIFLGMCFVGGIYPAVFMSSFQPIQVIKNGRVNESLSMLSIRKWMVIGQFTLSIVLIIGTIVAARQFQYMRDRALGFDAERVVLLPSLRSPIMEHYHSFKTQLLDRPEIKSITTVEDVPGMKFQTGSYQIVEGEDAQQIPRLVVHEDFLQTMGIKLAAGRDYQNTFKQDAEESVIINETLAKLLGWTAEEAIGKSIGDETIVGVTEDFHFASLHHEMGPFILEKVSDNLDNLAFSARYIALRVEGGQIEQTLAYIENQWFSFVPETPFEFHLLNQTLKEQYTAEAMLGKLTGVFSILSIIIACMGLYGLSSFSAQRRIKEIGIRKVIGASMSNLTLLLSASFIKLVLIATLLAWPIAYFILDKWLEAFAYRVTLDAIPFLTAGILAFLIVIMTVSYQAIKTSKANPVESLRNE